MPLSHAVTAHASLIRHFITIEVGMRDGCLYYTRPDFAKILMVATFATVTEKTNA